MQDTTRATIAGISKTLQDSDHGQRIRLSRSGKTIYLNYVDADEACVRIPETMTADIHAALATPDKIINEYGTTACEWALYAMELI